MRAVRDVQLLVSTTVSNFFLALKLAATTFNILKMTLKYHNFPGLTIKFHGPPGREIPRFSTTRGNPGAVPTQKRYFPSARFWQMKLTLHILVAGTALNVLNKLALTPGGGSNTNTRDALSKFTGTCWNKNSIFNWLVLKSVPFCFIHVWFISCLPKRTFVSPLTQKSIHLPIS